MSRLFVSAVLLVLSVFSSAQAVPKKGALVAAVYDFDLPKVRQLLAQGADVNENVGKGGNEVTPLLAAIATRQSETARLLILRGASLHARYEGYDVIDYARSLFKADDELVREIQLRLSKGGRP